MFDWELALEIGSILFIFILGFAIAFDLDWQAWKEKLHEQNKKH